MPKSVVVLNKNGGDIFYCPLCHYSLKNNYRGVKLHMKKSHQMENSSSKRTENIFTCFCGKGNCNKRKLHMPS